MKKFFSIFFLLLFTKVFSQSYGHWTQKASLPAQARHGAAAFSIGERVYFGTGHYNGGSGDVLFDDWWEYDPGSNSWTQKANFGGGLRKWARGFSVGTKGYLCNGEDTTTFATNDLWEYNPATNAWSQKANLPANGRGGACSFTIGKSGYLATGDWLSDFWAYEPSSDTWSQQADFPDLSGRICMVGFSIGDKGYMGTGADGNYLPVNDFYEYDPKTNTWTPKANFPGAARSGASGFSISGKGYIGVGTDWPNALNCFGDFYQYDLATDTWTQIEDFPGAARRFVASTSLSTRAFICTGTNGNNLNDLWEYKEFSSGINETERNTNVTVFPNPMTASVTLIITGEENQSLQNTELIIYDMEGKEVLKSIIKNQKSEIHRGNLAGGTYFYEVRNSKIIGKGKLVIE